jgi:hypothetical protein
MFGIKKVKLKVGVHCTEQQDGRHTLETKMEQKRTRKGKGNRKRKLKRMEQRKELEK